MLRTENTTAAKRLADSLRTTITTSAESLEDLKRSIDHRPTGNLSEVKAFCNTIAKDVDELRANVAPVHSLMKAPAAGDILDTGFKQLDVVDRILDMFEQRLKEAYGIEIKLEEEKPEPESNVPSEVVCDVEDVTNVSTSGTEMKTPAKAKISPKFDDVMPATPKLEDFGISSADLEAFQAAPTQDGLGIDGTPMYHGGMERGGGVEIGSGDYVEAVAKSMSALGIETPIEVADKFSARRHIALRGVMPGTTPRMMAGKGKMLDYTGIAGGYYEGRQLDFGDEDDGLRERYDCVSGFWKDHACFEDIVKAIGVVKNGDGFSQEEVVKVLGEALPGVDGMALLVGLTKLKVLGVSKPENGQAVYRYRS